MECHDPVQTLDLTGKSIFKSDDNKLGLYHTTDDNSPNMNTFIGNSPVYLRGNDLAIQFDEGLYNFVGTQGLWHLIKKNMLISQISLQQT